MYIANFESRIDEKILARGKNYYAAGLVTDMWAEIPNHYRAVVVGSIPYDVEIHLGVSGEILRHLCDCPYDMGEFCKHEAAVMFTIRGHLEQGLPLKQQGQQRGMRALLQALSKDELVNLLCELAVEYDLREDIFYRLDDDA